MIQLQERDRKILETGYEQQFLRTDQIQRYFFPEKTDRRARQRILALEQADLIRREEHFLLKGRAIIRLTKSGVSVAEERRSVLIPQRKTLDARTLIHDSVVTSVRLRLKEFWEANWIPEALIKSEEFAHIPDGMLVFPNGRQAAIEIENTPKGPVRFREIQERWRGVSVRLILYVATTPTMYRIVQSYLESGPKDLPFGLVSWEALENSAPKIWTVMGELDLLAKRSL